MAQHDIKDVNLTVRVTPSFKERVVRAAQRDRRNTGDWVRLVLERAIDDLDAEDESLDLPHDQVIVEMLQRNMITLEALDAARQRYSHYTEEDHRRAQELFEQGTPWI